MLSNILQPIDLSYISNDRPFEGFEIGNAIQFYEETLYNFSEYDIAIVGVKESRNSSVNNFNTEIAPEEIRKKLYKLNIFQNFPKIIDLGNIIDTETVEETYIYLEEILSTLHTQEVCVIIIGGSQDLTLCQYKALSGIKEFIDVTIIDEKIDYNTNYKQILCSNYIGQIMSINNPKIFDLCFFGTQQYYLNNAIEKTIDGMNFQNLRLGALRNNIINYEHIFRKSNIISIDIACLKSSEAMAKSVQTPNGFSAEEICLISRYSGMSQEVKSIGYYELNPNYDINSQSSTLYSQSIWYFLEGFTHRFNFDTNNITHENINFHCYVVKIKDLNMDLSFWHNKKINVWWLEIENAKKNNFFPCNFKDYDECSKGFISDYIFKILSKI